LDEEKNFSTHIEVEKIGTAAFLTIGKLRGGVPTCKTSLVAHTYIPTTILGLVPRRVFVLPRASYIVASHQRLAQVRRMGSVIPDVDAFPETGTPHHHKLEGYDLYKSLGSPKCIVAPMVDQSELAWRILCRRYGADLVYTPMINAKIYVQQGRGTHRVREGFFNQDVGEEGAHTIDLCDERKDSDRPLIVQFCANDPDMLLEAAQAVQDKCDAVDLNLGCPQQIAKRGKFGAFLMDDWDLVFRLINTLHLNLKVPVTAKFRVYDSVEKSIAYARMIQRAGAQIVTVHGRTREMKGHKTGLADWSIMRAVKEALAIPVFANGNILYAQDWRDCLAYTGCDGVMSAEGNLYNPTLFHRELGRDLSVLCDPAADHAQFEPMHLIRIAHEYLDIVARLKTPTSHSALKGHMFKITRPALCIHTDLRPVLGNAHTYDDGDGEHQIREYRAFVHELEKRLEADASQPTYYTRPSELPHHYVAPPHIQDASDRATRPDYIPHWYLQPYFRPPYNPPQPKDNKTGASSAPNKESSNVHNPPSPSTEAEPSVKRMKIES